MTCADLDVVAAVRSDAGCQRERNEDAAALIRPAAFEEGKDRGVLAIVADGMGGHSAGDVASNMAVNVIRHRYFESDGDWQTALIRAIEEANTAILERARASDAMRNMGTTCTALVIRDGLAWCGHVGDSRLYLARDGHIYSMTENHSAVMEQVRLGLLTPEEARRHDDRNVILRSLGTRPDVCVDTWETPLPIRDGDRFILCTDGLYDVVDDLEINATASTCEPVDAAAKLINLARDRGAPDNVTVAILAIRKRADQQPAKQTREGATLL